MIEHLGNLLDGIVADPDQGIDTFSLLSRAETQWLLAHSSGTRRELSAGSMHPAALRGPGPAHAGRRRRPVRGRDSVTVSSYERANRLAHHLRRHGFWPGRWWASRMDLLAGDDCRHSRHSQGGGAYLPLDPGHSAGRLEFALTRWPRIGAGRTRVASGEGGASRIDAGDQQGVSVDWLRRQICVDRDLERDRRREHGESRERHREVGPRLRDVHIRIHRNTQGRDDHARGRSQPHALDAGHVPVQRGGRDRPEDSDHLRCIRVGKCSRR